MKKDSNNRKIRKQRKKKKPFNIVYYLDSSYRKIFDKLDVILIPVISERNIEEISNICDGLILTGSANDVHQNIIMKNQ